MATTIDGELARHDAPRTAPWPVWLLLGGALGQFVVQLLPDWYSVFGPYFLVDGDMVTSWIGAVAPFVLAASLIVGADRWGAGRRYLLAGAGALAVFAVLTLASDIWWALWETNPGPIPDGHQPWLVARGIGAAIAFVAAYGLVAAGLWVAGTRPVRGPRLLAMAGIGAVATAGAALGLWTLTPYRPGADDAIRIISIVASGVLTPLGFAAIGAVGMAAIRAMPKRGWLPEVLIAVGATLASAGMAWTWSFWALFPQPELAFETLELVILVPNLAVAVGMVAMVVGFAVGPVGAPRTAIDHARPIS